MNSLVVPTCPPFLVNAAQKHTASSKKENNNSAAGDTGYNPDGGAAASTFPNVSAIRSEKRFACERAGAVAFVLLWRIRIAEVNTV